MIFGDPYKFAVIAEKVDPWSDKDFRNGIFLFSIGGNIFPSNLQVITYHIDLVGISKMGDTNRDVAQDQFLRPTRDIYDALYEITYPPFESDLDNDYTYLISTQSLQDAKCDIFLIQSGDFEKIIYGCGTFGFSIGEIVLERGYFSKIASEIGIYIKSEDYLSFWSKEI
ncbi:hypothetical protein JCM19000A_31710 [Silvimonas sp. JCM 19000]